ncbi:tubulin-like protein [Dysgonomonas alginatilytica]|uniref:Tubulin-like protein n=1 Tax=Dysgonomonas alginatilytica TaxID=1605892 RepID=A0A2V3PPH0_9BACT|nr:tubulin-like doman-containing protein [Dysgonomonas alginatilytica]PXV65009.1 tubulin-like protein [Dysgonomonas alginatilytica]
MNSPTVKNHLIIGLGGTGGKILREMRKRIYEEFRSNEPSAKVNIEYLYVDSSPADLGDRSDWKTMGGSVHLMDAQKVSIHGVGANVLDNLHLYPGIQSFINDQDRKQLDDIGALIAAGIGGQRRRLGRILFANNQSGDEQQRFTTRLLATVQRLVDKSKENVVTFHICAGLAGGTGSGSVIDTIAQIRKYYAPQHGVGDQYKIHLYLYVPEIIVANPVHNAGYYQANGYAALSELNALSVGAYKPFDVSGLSKDEYGSVKRLLDGCDAFEAAYLFSNINEAGRQLQLGGEISAAVSDFLFQKIISANMSVGGQMARLVGCENDGAEPERDGAGAPVHGRRFLAFGVKRVEYPETEVEEYVTYNFARQATRQLQYNIWRDGIGFDECSMAEVGLGFKADIQEKKTREELLLTDNYLTLSKPLVESVATKKWKEIASGWETWTQFFAEDTQANKEKKDWLSDFTNSCELQFNTNYRSQGVKEFYKIQRGEKNAYAAYIRRHIEEKLFQEWRSGAKSTLEIEKYVNLLIEDCESRIPKFKEKIAEYESCLEQEILPEIKYCNDEWNNIGWLRDAITNASSKIFASYKTVKCEFYSVQTRIEGYRYASELLMSVQNELVQMQNNVMAFHAMLTEMLNRVDIQVEAKCKPKSKEANGDAKIVKKYDPELVRETTKRFVTDEQQQKHNASQIRGELVKLLGEDGKRSFSSLFEKLDLNSMEDLFIKVCLTNASAMMNDLATADPTQKMLNVNILEKIKQEYNSDDRLEDFVRDLVRSAQCYLQFNNEEIAKVLPSGSTSMMRMIQLSLPEYNDPTNFRKKFVDMFGKICPGFNLNEDLSTNYKANQIVVVAASSGFPLRFVANVANLKTKYEDMLIGPKASLNKMVLHTESFKKALPSLFEKSIAEKKKELIPTSILAFAMDLTVEKTDPTTGETFRAIGFADELGMVGDWVHMGKHVLQAVDKLSVSDSNMSRVSALVETKLNTDYLHNEKKVELKKKIADLLNNDVLVLCGNNDLDAQFVTFKNAAIAIIQTKLVEK